VCSRPIPEHELVLIQTQMTQKPMLWAEGECACVAQMARAKIRRRGWPSPSQRARNLWVVRTLKMHRGRRLTCGTRSSVKAEVKNGLSTHKAPYSLPPGAPTGKELPPQPIPTPSDTRRSLALMQFSRFSVMLTMHYRRLAADYLCLGYYCRCTMMAARERKLKSGACLGGH
jgi:hypothetical protein